MTDNAEKDRKIFRILFNWHTAVKLTFTCLLYTKIMLLHYINQPTNDLIRYTHAHKNFYQHFLSTHTYKLTQWHKHTHIHTMKHTYTTHIHTMTHTYTQWLTQNDTHKDTQWHNTHNDANKIFKNEIM